MLWRMRRILGRRDVDSAVFRFSSQAIEKQWKIRRRSRNFGLTGAVSSLETRLSFLHNFVLDGRLGPFAEIALLGKLLLNAEA